MNPVLFHIYGPLAIHAYGFCIAIGGLIALYLLTQDTKIKKLLSPQELVTTFYTILLGAYFGGRIICMLSQPDFVDDYWFMLKFWEPGFSILGSIIGVTVTLAIYLHIKKVSFFAFLDRVSIYAPLAQAFGRLGCFFAGCCYGKPTDAWYAILYDHPNHMAPLNCGLHPAQLYSTIALFSIFLFLYFFQQYRARHTGMIFFSYLALVSAERFLIDFVRWDRVFVTEPTFLQLFSYHQWIAIGIIFCTTIGILITSKHKK